MMFKGTKTRTGKDIDAYIESLGGQHNAYTTLDHTVYYIQGPSEHAQAFLEILTDMLMHSTLNESDWTTEKDVILREIDMYLDEPWDYLSHMAMAARFQTSPYRYPIIGYKKRLAGLQRDVLCTYHQARYVPERLVVCVAGAVTAQDLDSWVHTLWGGFKPAASVFDQEQAFEEPLGQGTCLRLEGPYNSTYGMMQFDVPMDQQKPSAAVAMLSYVLGLGESSLLWKRLFEQYSLVSDVSCHMMPLCHQGLLQITYDCQQQDPRPTEDEIWAVCQMIQQNGIDPQLLASIKQQAKVAQIDAAQTVRGQATRLGYAEVVYADAYYPDVFMENLMNVHVDDVQAIAQTILMPVNAQTVSLRQGQFSIDLNDHPTQLPIQPQTPLQRRLDRQPLAVAILDYPKKPQLTDVCHHPMTWPIFEHLEGAVSRAYLQATQHFRKVYAQIVFGGGTLAEKPHERGGCMLLMSFLRRCRPSLIEKMESLGVKLDDYVLGCSMGLTLECLAEDFQQVMTDVQDMFCPDHFERKDNLLIFEREKKAQIAHIKLDEDDLPKQAFRHFRQLFFGLHPFKDSPMGTLATVEQLTFQDIHHLYQRLMVQSNLDLIVAGVCAKTTVSHALKGLTEDMPLGDKMCFDAPFICGGTKNEVIDIENRHQAIVFEGYPMPGYAQVGLDRYTMAVVMELLNAMSGLLFSSIREAGLGYYAAGSVIKGWDQSCFVLYAGTQPGQQQAIYDQFDGVRHQLQAGQIHPQALSRAKKSLVVQHKMKLQTLSGRSVLAADHLLYQQPINDWQHYEDYIHAVSIDSIKELALTWMDPQQRVRLVVQGR